MKSSNGEPEGVTSGYRGESIMPPDTRTNEPIQVVINRAQKAAATVRETMMVLEQRLPHVLGNCHAAEMDVGALRLSFEEIMQEKLYIEELAERAEKRLQEAENVVSRYVGVVDAVVASDGSTYEREVISAYIESCKENGTTPTSHQTESPLTSLLIPNRSLKTLVDRLETLLKAEPASPGPVDRVPTDNPKPTAVGRPGRAPVNPHESQRRGLRGTGKDGPGPYEFNAKGEPVHPCIRVYGFCNYNEGCAYANYPYDACLSNLKNKCRFRNQCHEPHVPFRGPLDGYGNPLPPNHAAHAERGTTAEPTGVALTKA